MDIVIVALITCSSISIILLLLKWAKKIPQSNHEQLVFFIRIRSYIHVIGYLLVFLMTIGLIFNVFQIDLNPKYGAFARVINFAASASPINKALIAMLGAIMILTASKFKNKIKK